jgi:hypothetical protein
MIYRAFWRVMGMACSPDDLYTDPDIVARTHEIIRNHGSAPPMAQPTRDQLLTALEPAA